MACLIRVPVEVVKQRRQTLHSSKHSTSLKILLKAYKHEGIRVRVKIIKKQQQNVNFLFRRAFIVVLVLQ